MGQYIDMLKKEEEGFWGRDSLKLSLLICEKICRRIVLISKVIFVFILPKKSMKNVLC